eukprot:3216641-Amphidinium_carterae.1
MPSRSDGTVSVGCGGPSVFFTALVMFGCAFSKGRAGLTRSAYCCRCAKLRTGGQNLPESEPLFLPLLYVQCGDAVGTGGGVCRCSKHSAEDQKMG